VLRLLFAVDRRLTFFLLRQEESKQRRRRPRVGARCAGSLRYSVLAGAAELGPAGLRQSSPFFRQALRCSAPPRGGWQTDRSFTVNAENGRKMPCTAKSLFLLLASQLRRLWAPWEAPSNAGGAGEVGSHCLSRRRVHASRPACRVAQGTRAAGADPGVAFFFGYFLFGEPKRKYARRPGGTPGQHQPRSLNISRNRFGAGRNGVRTDVHAPCRAGTSQPNRLPSHDTIRYNAGER